MNKAQPNSSNLMENLWTAERKKLRQEAREKDREIRTLEGCVQARDEVIEDYGRLTKQLDDVWNGTLAAQRPALVDVLVQITKEYPILRNRVRVLQLRCLAVRDAAVELHKTPTLQSAKEALEDAVRPCNTPDLLNGLEGWMPHIPILRECLAILRELLADENVHRNPMVLRMEKLERELMVMVGPS